MPLSRVDHLIVAADTLAQGAQWCEATLGIRPREGGEHPLMGTHNLLLRMATQRYPLVYFEIIAINPAAPPPGHARWFDLDDPHLQHALCKQPRLVHFVARSDQAAGALKALGRLGIERGALVHAQRQTPRGLLRWQISVRADGQRLFYGGLPTLIQWDGPHPCETLPEAGLALQSLQVRHPRLAELQAAHEAIGLQLVDLEQGAPDLVATLTTPKGVVILESAGH